MTERGTIVAWKDERGFGFIHPESGGQDVFLHATALKGRTRRPQPGDTVSYALGMENGKVRAVEARLEGVGAKFTLHPFPLVLIAFCLFGAVHLFLKTQLPIGFAYPVMSIITYAAYAQDKNKAEVGAFRTPEATLHFLELSGGWPGAYVAQEKLRHKTKKTSYRSAFWFIVFLHIAFWGWWLLLGPHKLLTNT